MMHRLLEKFRVESTGLRKQQHPKMSASLEVEKDNTGASTLTGFGYSEKYIAELRLSVSFWANHAEFQDAKRIAFKALFVEIYKEALGNMDLLMSYISDDEKEEAYNVINKMRKDMLGETA